MNYDIKEKIRSSGISLEANPDAKHDYMSKKSNEISHLEDGKIKKHVTERKFETKTKWE